MKQIQIQESITNFGFHISYYICICMDFCGQSMQLDIQSFSARFAYFTVPDQLDSVFYSALVTVRLIKK